MKKIIRSILIILFFVYGTNVVYSQSWIEKAKQATHKVWKNTKEKSQQIWKNSKPQRDKTAKIIKEKSKSAWENSAKQRAVAWDGIKKGSKYVYNNLRKIDYNKIIQYKNNAQNYMTTSCINAARNVPVKDPKTGRTTTFNNYCRELILQTDAGQQLAGNSAVDDPVGTGVMLLMDNGYIFDMDLIKTRNGEWISVKEATGFEGNSISADCWAAYDAYNSNNYVGFTRSFTSMMIKIEKYNNRY